MVMDIRCTSHAHEPAALLDPAQAEVAVFSRSGPKAFVKTAAAQPSAPVHREILGWQESYAVRFTVLACDESLYDKMGRMAPERRRIRYFGRSPRRRFYITERVTEPRQEIRL